MNNEYTYEIMAFVPADSWAKVKYEREGSLPYFRLFTLTKFDEASLREVIESYAHIVFDHWDRATEAPAELPIVGRQSAVRVPIKPVRDLEPEVMTDPITEMLVDEVEETEDEIVFKRVVKPRPVEGQGEVVRSRRDFLLKLTDHYAGEDVVMSDEMRTYRQALRDVTDQDGYPSAVVWPVEPQ